MQRFIIRSTTPVLSGYTYFVQQRGGSLRGAASDWANLSSEERSKYAVRDLEAGSAFASPRTLHASIYGTSAWDQLPESGKKEWTDRSDRLAKKYIDDPPPNLTAVGAYKMLSKDKKWRSADRSVWDRVAHELNVERELAHKAFVAFAKERSGQSRDDVREGWSRISAQEKHERMASIAKDQGIEMPSLKLKRHSRAPTLASAASSKRLMASRAREAAETAAAKYETSAKYGSSQAVRSEEGSKAYSPSSSDLRRSWEAMNRYSKDMGPRETVNDDLALYRRLAHAEDEAYMRERPSRPVPPRVQSATGKTPERVGASAHDDFELGDELAKHSGGELSEDEFDVGRSKTAYRGAAVLGLRAATSPVMLGIRSEQSKHLSSRDL